MTIIYSILLGVAGSLIASAIVAALFTNRADVKFFLQSRNRYSWITGTWHQYHLTRDRGTSLLPIWVHHVETLKINKFGRIRGTSTNKYEISLTYTIIGNVRDNVLRLKFFNDTSKEAVVVIAYPDLLNNKQLVGAWQGQDFQRRWTIAPIIMSSEVRSIPQLRKAVRQISIPRRRLANLIVEASNDVMISHGEVKPNASPTP